MANELPQPDFAVLARAFTDIVTELAKHQNVPALDQGQQILQTLAQLRIDMNSNVNNLELKMDALYVGSRNKGLEEWIVILTLP